ncbi:MAG: amidohydrolase, partial [Longimicrobiales bacterium]|nr:amidohydrolase [Longimicrobiales bacterium]
YAADYGAMAQEIWELAEVGYQEHESSEVLQARLRAHGFRVTAGVAGIPTAFVAEWGSGGPVLGILAEFDALPGITQSRSPERDPLAGKGASHACGHHLFGTGSVAAGLAARDWLERTGSPGVIRVYGTPAEEGGAGKVYLVREGLFDDVDVVVHWHPGDSNAAAAQSSLANKSAKFRFRGVSAHAAASPERGRSALDGVEAMNHMVNLMREHVPQEARIHYVITYGGAAPNVIPDFAEVFYYVRHPDPAVVAELFERVADAARGAALGTGTEVDFEVIHGIYNVLINVPLAEKMHANLLQVGGVAYTPEERRFAELIRTSLGEDAPPVDAAAEVQPFFVNEDGAGRGSTDVADVSWAVPTVGLRTATWVPGTASHSWQAVAAGGTTIGEKGMIVAAKTMALTLVDLFQDDDLRSRARVEWTARRGPDFVYRPLLGDRDPPLDYRSAPGGG